MPKVNACLSNQELPISIQMAVAKNQPVLLAWLRAVALAIKPQVEAERTGVELAGS